MDNSDFEYLYRQLEREINVLQAKRDNYENGLRLLKNELGRINDRIDELTHELIFVIDRLRKF